MGREELLKVFTGFLAPNRKGGIEGLVTPKEVAEKLGVTVKTLYYWRDKYEVPYVKFDRLIRFAPSKAVSKLETDIYFEEKRK